MQQNKKESSAGGIMVAGALLLNAIVLEQGFIAHSGYSMLLLTFPLLIASIFFKHRQQ
jgi:hypothetical protein